MRASVLLLAAGASRRLGRPKQLLDVGGEPLVRRLAREALAVVPDVLVVEGAVPLSEALAGLSLRLVPNGDWAEGMGASLRAGVAALSPGTEAVLVMACDQPNVDAAFLGRMLGAAEGVGARVAAAYAGTRGIPALFGRAWFPALEASAGDRGAKALLQGEGVLELSFPEGARDLDTPEDVDAWLGSTRTSAADEHG